MKLVNRLKFTTTATSLASVTSFTGIAKFRTPAQAIADGKVVIGQTGLQIVAEDATNWEESYFTVGGTAQNPTLTRERVSDSSNGGNPVTFSGAVTMACTVFAEELAGVSVLDLPLVSTAPTNASIEITLADGSSQRIYPGSLQANGGTSTPVDNPPTLSALSASATGATTATGSVTTNETGGTLYWLFSTSSTATAAQVKAGNSMTVTAAGAQTLPGTGLTASTQYYLHVLHRDTYPQDSAVLSLGSPFTTQAAGTPSPTVTGVTVSPSSANVAAGGTQQLTATVAGTNSPSQGVNWTASPSSAGTVNSSGLFTAASTGSAQTATVTATSQQDPSKSGTATIAVAAVAAPGQVTGLTAGTPTSNSVPLSWAAVSGASAYTVNYRTAGSSTWTAASTTVTGTSYTPTGLSASQAYEFQVIATNVGGAGTPSATISATTAAASSGHTIAPYTAGNTVKTALAKSAADGTYANAGSYFAPTKAMTTPASYFNITPNVAAGTNVRCGWSKSNTVPPAEITAAQNASGDLSVNGLVPMADRADPAWENVANLWVSTADLGVPFYLWFRIGTEDICYNAAGGLVVT
jgi:hypothetical protein